MENRLQRLQRSLEAENERHRRQVNNLKSQIYKVKEEISRQKESEIRKYGIN